MVRLSDILALETVERRLEFARVPSGWAGIAAILLFALLLASVLFLYAHEQRSGASPRMRRGLAILRCATLGVLALVWLEPVLATYLHRRTDAFTLVLVDSSASMSLPDRYVDPAESARVRKVLDDAGRPAAGAMTRWSVATALLERDNARLLRELAAGNSVKVIRFGDHASVLGQLEPGSNGPGRGSGPASRPEGQPDSLGALAQAMSAAQPDLAATDIGRAVRQAVESAGHNPVAAVVVLSDGRFNHGEPPEVVAQYARDKRIPVYAVGIGDASPPRNAAVAAVEAPPNVFVQDPFKIVAHVRAEGLEGETLTLELLERGPGADPPRVLGSRQVQVASDGQVPPVVFNHKIGEAAEDRLSVRIVPHPAETITEDNVKETVVRALANRMRVLVVAGGPSWEYRYLSRLLERDKTANVSCWLQSAEERAVREGSTTIDHFPREIEELAPYDCIVLLDPQPGDINPAWTGMVEKLVSERGCGLLYVAGRQNTARLAHDPQAKPLLDLLPVVVDPGEADLVLNELGHFQRTDWAAVPQPGVQGSPVLALSDRPDENEQVWARLRGVFWHYPVRREKPVATVLLRHSNPAMHNAYGSHVLLATQFVGSGRTGFLGFDTTWRWRRFGDGPFNRFWIQLLRHMVEGKLLSGQRRGFIQVERAETGMGEPVTVEARLLDAAYQPLAAPDVQASVTVEGKAAGQIRLAAQPNRPGWYRGQFVPTQLGMHSLRIDLPADSAAERATINGEIKVGRPDIEFQNARLDRESMETLAARSAGGRYLDLDGAARLPALIPSKARTMVLTGQSTSLWDGWWTLVILVFLLSTEWFVRKRVHLL